MLDLARPSHKTRTELSQSVACGFGAGLELTRGLPRPEPRRREPYRQQTLQPWRIFFPRVDGTGLLSAPPQQALYRSRVARRRPGGADAPHAGPFPRAGGWESHSHASNAESLPDATGNPPPAAPHEPVAIQRCYARALQCGVATQKLPCKSSRCASSGSIPSGEPCPAQMGDVKFKRSVAAGRC